ncbi:tetratricopeptide repeat protein [Desulfopila sp. IMCC35006]|uniref:tetratricopeptide repeat protein n=1 Tax=Desulfopila sp. IMCC35006 TaxID=2569542 RepID=UPI0010ABA755|nr:tetratricopeptide repeat protein [Desulfopila sp. IMCC35006]TKB24938.1 tetratricopeptide repeat protein [Desulfopila sp. IMCC35006]
MTVSRFTVLILTILLISTLTACSTPDEKKEKHYLRALEYIKINDDKAAALELKNAIQIDAKFAKARYQLGLLYMKAGNAQASFGELQRTASLDPKNLDAGVKVAEFYLLSRKKADSRRFVEQVLRVDPNYQDGLALLANLELIEGNFAKAEASIDKAIAQAPDNDRFYNIKGRILIAQDKWAESEKLFQKAIQLNPDNIANYRTMLMFYEQKKDEPAIQKLLHTMIPKFPNNPQMHMILANLYQQKGELDKAEKEMLRIVAIDKKSIPSRLMLAHFYTKHQQFDKAEKTLTAALLDFPNDLQLKVELAELRFDLQKFDQAHAIMESVLKTNPANGGANLIKARFLIRDGKNSEAMQIITPLLADYPKWPDLFYYTALTQLRLDQAELAQKYIDQALQNDPTNDRYHALAAQIYLIQGNNIEAEKEAALAVRINGRNAIAVKILAKSLVQAKKYAKAIEFIENLNQEAVAGDAELLGSLAVAYLGQDNKDKARQTFADVMELAPDNSRALDYLTALTFGPDIPGRISFVKAQIAKSNTAGHYLLLGELLTKNKQYEEALHAYQKVQELAPDNPQGYVLAARLLSHLGRIDATIAQYEDLLSKKPDSIAGIMGLATAYEVQGALDKAKRQYTRALELQPNLPAASNNLAWLLASEEGADLGEALRLAMQAKQALPEQPEIADTLGWVHYKRKSYSLAISQFRQALETSPDNPTIQYHLALALYGNDQKLEAIQSIEKILTSESEFAERKDAEILLQQWKKG